jgi:acetyl esterase/lipase
MIRTLRFLLLTASISGLWAPDAPMAQEQRPSREGRPPLPERVHAHLNIPYAGTDNPRQMLDLYLPKDPTAMKRLPVVVWIHGGAWLGGDKSSGRGMLIPLVASGDYAGVSIGYRLTNEAVWPAQIYDCKAAIRWIRANAKKYNLDPDHIGIWGSSAGGHLVAMLGTSGGVKQLEGTLGKHLDQDSRVTCVVDYFGPSDLLAMGKYPSQMKHDAPDSPESKLLGGPLQEMQQAARSASPITYVSKDDPPFLIVHGDQDPLVPYNQSQRLTEALRKAGTDVTLITVQGGGHGGFQSRELTRRVHRFFDKHLRGREVEISPAPISQGQGAG